MAGNIRNHQCRKVPVARRLNSVLCFLPASTPALFHTGIFPGIVS